MYQSPDFYYLDQLRNPFTLFCDGYGYIAFPNSWEQSDEFIEPIVGRSAYFSISLSTIYLFMYYGYLYILLEKQLAEISITL